MANKIFGVKNITHLLYGIIVLLPMFAILGRVIYTQSNVNAKDSYSDYTQIVKTKYALGTTLTSGDYVYVNYYGPSEYGNYATFNILENQTNIYQVFNIDTDRDISFVQFQHVNDNYRILIRTLINHSTINDLTINNWNTLNKPFWFIASSGTIPSNQPFFNMTYNVYTKGTLDNAFEYSLKIFTEDNNLGEVDMFSWFTDLFLDHSNAHNQIYIGFVNWYLNYTMLVSCGYLFFLVLIWFVNFVRKILDKSMYQDYGGF